MKIGKRLRIFAVSFVILAVLTAGSIPCQAKPKTTGINVQYHSKKSIRNFVKKHKFNTRRPVAYTKKPSVKNTSFQAGQLKKVSLNDGLNALNVMRYVAGLPANVKADKAYNKQCQAAALVNAANGQLSHFPSKPAGMSKTLYKLGKAGAGSSNIAWNYGNLASSVLYGWMADSDMSNIDRLGHRRWILNPSMKKTGFGFVNNYSAMYAFDNSFGNTKYYGVAWPAQNMPVEYFSNDTAWSVSMGESVVKSKVKVTLTRKRDGKKWIFSNKKSNGYFNVENSGYGRSGCIIFRPENVDYKSGDIYKVKITGLKKTVNYEVNFFKL